MTEEWREIPGFPYYEASSAGRIRRRAGAPRTPVARVLRPRKRTVRPGRLAYLDVALSHDGAISFQSVHKLVALAFLGPPPTPLHEVAHGDHDPTNPRPANLAWATSLENKRASVLAGRYPGRPDFQRDPSTGRFVA